MNNAKKSRISYILLAFFFGCLGVHNFYAGYNKKGIAQLLISLLSFGILSPIVGIWCIIEMCTVTKDSAGNNFC